MNVGDEIWILNAQRVVQTTIIGVLINFDGVNKYVTLDNGVYEIDEMGRTKKELMEKFFGDISNPYRHRFLR
jgi:hypothetical protein|tara:strand:+ start:416 stop:631 length:216 start_codon:yes stop_codon:yes gene_type:complete